jgi:hypothetical protein
LDRLLGSNSWMAPRIDSDAAGPATSGASSTPTYQHELPVAQTDERACAVTTAVAERYSQHHQALTTACLPHPSGDQSRLPAAAGTLLKTPCTAVHREMSHGAKCRHSNKQLCQQRIAPSCKAGKMTVFTDNRCALRQAIGTSNCVNYGGTTRQQMACFPVSFRRLEIFL